MIRVLSIVGTLFQSLHLYFSKFPLIFRVLERYPYIRKKRRIHIIKYSLLNKREKI